MHSPQSAAGFLFEFAERLVTRRLWQIASVVTTSNCVQTGDTLRPLVLCECFKKPDL